MAFDQWTHAKSAAGLGTKVASAGQMMAETIAVGNRNVLDWHASCMVRGMLHSSPMQPYRRQHGSDSRPRNFAKRHSLYLFRTGCDGDSDQNR